MNYRHIYHAGNFGDVLKHIVLARVIEHLKRKEKAFRIFDTHAGIGQYDLSSEQAQKTGEWREGIGKLLLADIPKDVAQIIAPYLDIVREGLTGDTLTTYPGSPIVARKLLRKQDRLSLTELHPQDAKTLAGCFAGDYQVRVNELDGWLVAGAHLPPKEKRGAVLIDPPFEEQGELDKMVAHLATAYKRWPGGTYCLWYPIKHQLDADAYCRQISQLGIKEVLRVEITVRPANNKNQMNGAGLTIVNPPFTLEGEMKKVLPFMQKAFGQTEGSTGKQGDKASGYRLDQFG